MEGILGFASSASFVFLLLVLLGPTRKALVLIHTRAQAQAGVCAHSHSFQATTLARTHSLSHA